MLRTSRIWQAARFYSSAAETAAKTATKIKRHEKHTVVDTKEEENLVPRAVAPLDASKIPQGNMLAHILQQYKMDLGEHDIQLSGWKKYVGERLIKTFNLDMDRIRSGPVAAVLYRDQCKMQAYFEKGKPISPLADWYYNRLGMPQTYFQWFQITSLHIWMLYVRMRRMPRKYCREYQTKLVNGIFEDIDYTLREVIRVNSDRTANNHKKQFSEQLRGSVFSYDEAMLGGDTVLAGAIWRNLFEQSDVADPTIIEHIVQYVRAQLYVLDMISDRDFAAGRFQFLDPRYRYEPLSAAQYAALDEMIESARKESKNLAARSQLSREGL